MEQKQTSRTQRQLFWVFFSVLAAGFLVILPRLLQPDFGLFDDATTLTVTAKIWAGEWTPGDEADSGRFRPAYWLYYALLGQLGGGAAIWFFLGNALLWLGLLAGVVALALGLGMKPGAAWLAGMLLVFGAPTWENIYTLSKAELLQGTCFVLGILLSGWQAQPGFKQRAEVRLACGLAASLFFLLASLAKETGVLLAGSALAGWLLYTAARFFLRQSESPAQRQRWFFLVNATVGAALYLGLRWFYLPFGLLEQGYASRFTFDLAWLIEKARQWADWLLRDYLYLIPIGLAGILWLWLSRRETSKTASRLRVLELLAWLALWLGMYIPWQYTQEYYLFPFAIGAALLGAELAAQSWEMGRSSGWLLWVGWGGLAASGLLLATLLPSMVTNIRAQMAMDRANMEMLDLITSQAAPGSQVWVNLRRADEYSVNIQTWIRVHKQRPDLQVAWLDSADIAATLASAGGQGQERWFVAPVVENQFYPSVRMGVYEMEARGWEEELLDYLGEDYPPSYEIRQSFRSFNVDVLRTPCPLLEKVEGRRRSFCSVPNNPADRRMFGYAWRIYHLQAEAAP